MDIKKFEKYEHDENGNIGEEYAKEIVSKYLDDLDGYSDVNKSLQDSFDHYCEEIEEDLRGFVKEDLYDVINDLQKDYKKIEYSDKYYEEKKIKADTKKYNL